MSGQVPGPPIQTPGTTVTVEYWQTGDGLPPSNTVGFEWSQTVDATGVMVAALRNHPFPATNISEQQYADRVQAWRDYNPGGV